MPQQIKVIDYLGNEEIFSERKVLRSLKKSGSSQKIAIQILDRLRPHLYDGIATSEIFKFIRQELKREQPEAAIKFNLKDAIRNLGPDGFSFEKYVKQIFENYGFAVKIDQYIPGKCLPYETDILAENQKKIYFGECKYRNHPGERIDLGVCMKLFAAATDVCATYFKDKIKSGKKVIPIVVTNAKFTSQAIKYAKCQNIELLGWNYPKDKGLENLIEEKKLYPITILPSFRPYMNSAFGNAGVMLASDLINIKDMALFSKKIGIPLNKITILCREAQILFNKADIVKNL
jgi:hypothetical protein